MSLCAGIDEVGRGCLAGPVVVACVILPNNVEHEHESYIREIKDSKKLSEKKRMYLDEFIKYIAIDYSIVFIDNKEIDLLNIRNATLKGMQQSYLKLNVKPEHLFVDGDFYLPIDNEEYSCIPQGDSKVLCISAASILAKVARDTYCKQIMHQEYPHYGWEKNKAYGTKVHYDALETHGITPYHRKSFNLKCK